MDHRNQNHGRQSPPIWPFLLVLVFLFAMSITSPRHWERYAQRTPLEPCTRHVAGGTGPTRITATYTMVTERVPAVGSPAEPQPRVTSQYATKPTTATTQAAQPTFAQPNLGPAPALRLSGALPAKAPQSQVQSIAALPNIAAPNLSVPTLSAPTLAPAQTTIASSPVAPNLPTPAPVIAPKIAAAPTITVQTYRPSPSGFVLHGGHKPGAPIAAAPIIAPLASVSPKIAEPSKLENPSATPKPQQPAPKAPPVVQPPVAAATSRPAQPELVASRMSPAAGANPTRALPTPKVIAVPTPQPAPTPVVVKTWWPRPVDLLARLEHLAENRDTQSFAERSLSLLAGLDKITDAASPRTLEIVQQLRATLNDPKLLDEQKLDPRLALQVRLTRHALQRRLDVWESLSTVVKHESTPPTLVRASSEDLAVCLVELERETAEAGATGRQWRDYLMLDTLGQAARGAGDEAQRRELARTILERMHKAAASDERNAFLKQGAFASLDEQLQTLAATELDGHALLESIERFEGGGLPSDAHALARQCKMLDLSEDAERKQLALWLTSHYRNANVRVTLSADLLNRMLPEPLRQNAPVNETVLGMPTQGWSSTRTGIGINFLPSNDSLAVRMTANGLVHAQTQTFSGPVRLFSHSDSNFTAYKDFSLTPRGVEVVPATATTSSRSRLQGIRTEFDHMPILGSIVESIALDQHAEKRVPAQREAAAKVSRQVERGLDRELDKHLQQADDKLDAYVVAPLAKLGLAPDVIELQSNEQRAIMRVRIAGADQLASHTPRPRAYSDNVASVQVHQSAINNVLERLALQGRHFTAPELYRFAVDELYLPDVVDPATIPSDIEVTFAKVDPITIHCDNGRVELRLAIEELQRAGKSWRDFTVRTEFKTEIVDGCNCFVRDGLIHLSGPRLGTTSQIALRTVFAKVFPDDMRVPLWPEKLGTDPRFADLDVQQVDIRDGWIGMAIGPRRVQSAMGLVRPRR
ncbi:MAG: hypothetical protein C0483_04355 [Pirellula sp.]|nr:hypothetical protein [Pirellula sp.]